MAETCYADSDNGRGQFKVTFLVNASNTRLTKSFESPYFARKFVNKLRHSKSCTLLAYPRFEY